MPTFIHPTATVYHERVTLGENVYIGPYCIIGGAPEYPNRHPDEPCGRVYIGNDCILHGYNSVDCATEAWGVTTICSKCTLMKGAHVGHDCLIYDNVTLSCGCKIGGFSNVGMHSTIGLNATLHQHSHLNTGAMIGANAFFKGGTKERFETWAGVPARFIKVNQHLKDKLGVK
jgi:UDP-N-acetylglucosamine acyltransferase